MEEREKPVTAEEEGRFAARFQRLVDSSPAIIWAYDEINGRMLYLNDAVRETLGHDVRRYFERPTFWFELIHPDDRPLASSLNAAMREEKKVITYRVRFHHADGRYVALSTAVKPIMDQRGRIVRTEGAAISVVGEEPKKEDK